MSGMNYRHHPYGSVPENPNRRTTPGPGPDRQHRYQDRGGPPGRGRGYGRGRGGYHNNYETNNVNDDYSLHGQPQQEHSYNNYGAQGPGQEPHYSSYPPGPTYQYPAAYDQGYPQYEGALEC